MPPKGKAAAKAGAKPSSSGKASPQNLQPEVIPVPPPPRSPVLVRFTETADGDIVTEDPAARCVLLSWCDKDNVYKLQSRLFAGPDADEEKGWADVPPSTVKLKELPGRDNVYLVSGLPHIRSEFRLASKTDDQPKLDGRYTANWFSAPCEPVLSMVDAPAQPRAEVIVLGNYSNPGTRLTFSSVNQEVDEAAQAGAVDGMGPWAMWPGLCICRAQARWRLLRPVDDIEGRPEKHAATKASLPKTALEGSKQVGHIVDLGTAECPFDATSGTWSFVATDMPSGFVVRLEVRVGTAYRWSSWSQETEDVSVMIPLPRPQAKSPFVMPVSVTDSSAVVRWAPFQLAEGLSLCEYQVRVCQMPGRNYDNKTMPWDESSAFIAGIFTAEADGKDFEFTVKPLVVDMHYAVMVEARYPFTGSRQWCTTPAMTQFPIHTDFAEKSPPAGPLPLPAADVELLFAEGGFASPFGDDQAWLPLLVESWAAEDYRIEFAPCKRSAALEQPGTLTPAAPATTEDLGQAEPGDDDSEGSKDDGESDAGGAPAGQVNWMPAIQVKRLDGLGNLGSSFVAIAALLPDLWASSKGKPEGPGFDSVVCRLRHKHPAAVSPFLGTGSTSVPMLPKVEPPAMPSISARFSPADGSFGFMVRFFLGSAAPMDQDAEEDADKHEGAHDQALGVASYIKKAASGLKQNVSEDKGLQRSRTKANMNLAAVSHTSRRHLLGHRLVKLVQVRFCEKDEDDEDSTWTVMNPLPLPPARPRHANEYRMGPLPLEEKQLRYGTTELVWDLGDRHEVWLGKADGFMIGRRYAVQLRVGADECWSPWSVLHGQQKGQDCVLFEPMLAKPVPPRPNKDVLPVHLVLSAESTSSMVARFMPWVLPPGAGTIEYIVTAVPRLAAEEGKNTAAESEQGGADVVKHLIVQHEPTRSDGEVVYGLFARDAFRELQEQHPLGFVNVLFQHESDHDLEAAHKRPEIEVLLTGLLPATSYEVSITAQYPGLPMFDGERVTEVCNTPCGEAPPLAPKVLDAELAIQAGCSPFRRELLLEIEDRSDYILQCVPTPSAGWFPQSMSKKKSDNYESDNYRWWPSSTTGQEELCWAAVQFRMVPPAPGQMTGTQRVVAELPGFGGRTTGDEPADVLSFRLAARDRSSCHSGRWVGGQGSPVPCCIAPLSAPPMPKRHFSESSWRVEISFFLHKSSRPQGTATVEQLCNNGLPPEANEVCSAELLDEFITGVTALEESQREDAVLAQDGDGDGDGGVEGIPAGFGHRAVTLVQVRAKRVGTAHVHGNDELPKDAQSGTDGWHELPVRLLNQCTVKTPAALRGTTACKIGDLHSYPISMTQDFMAEGSIYQVQVRLGDGHRWSAWSQSSGKFPFAVPQPRPPQELHLETLSANTMRFHWPAFTTPLGLKQVAYCLQAEPVVEGSGDQAVHAVAQVHVLPDNKFGEPLHAELANLQPDTEYRFSVSARYEYIGWRSWSKRLESSPQMLDEEKADWQAPPMPAVFPCNGPRPFVLAPEGSPFFHPTEQAFFLGFADTNKLRGGHVYRLEYRFVGLSADLASGKWRRPLETLEMDVEGTSKQQLALEFAVAPWKLRPKLWRVRLPLMPVKLEAISAAHAQQVQFRLASEAPESCPPTRWFSSCTPPLCSAIAPPVESAAELEVTDTHLTLFIQFALDKHLAALCAEEEDIARADAQFDRGGAVIGNFETAKQFLPTGFGHAHVTRFQIRSRHSPRPPGVQVADSSRRPPGIPWSAWCESPDAGWQAAQNVSMPEDRLSRFVTSLTLPDGALLDYGSYYQVSIRISDGICWSDWSEPSDPVKVYVAPPRPVKPDSDVLSAVKDNGGNNVRLKWNSLRAHRGLKIIEYVLEVHQVLPDGSELCDKRVAALWQSRAAGEEESPDGPDDTTYELRDLRTDANYVFTLAARYPHVGPREFSEALRSFPTSLRPAAMPLATPLQLPMPPERLQRLQLSRFVLLRFGLAGVPLSGEYKEFDIEVDGSDRRYDLQTLPEGSGDHQWLLCKSVARLRIDGHLAWLVKEIPGRALRTRFRLWDRDTGRFGRASPLMLTFVDAITKLGVMRVVSESSLQIMLRAPLESPSGAFVCRYQIRFRAEKLDAAWVELPPQMLWHRQNDHMATFDEPTDAKGAVHSGLADQVDSTCKDALNSDALSTEAKPQDVPPGQCQVSLPTIPLATIRSSGEVSRQHCLVATLRHEDGLQEDIPYTFSIRVGDLFRFSEWSPASEFVRLALPPPQPSPELSNADAQITVTDVTDVALHASWPQFIPAPNTGAPVQAEIEYMLVVLPQAPKRRVAGRAQPKEEPPAPHAQWLLSSKIAEGADDPAQVARRLGMTVSGLTPYSSYELKLSVRYSRLGTRTWHHAMSYIVVTKKSEGITGRSSPPLLPGDSSSSRQGLAAETSKLDSKHFLKVKEGPVSNVVHDSTRAESPRRDQGVLHVANTDRQVGKSESFVTRGSASVPESPRRLPPLDTSTSTLYEEVAQANAEEWVAGAHADATRIMGGSGPRDTASLLAAGQAEAQAAAPGYPLDRPSDYVPFWRRDPMDSRPAMPMMPPASHSAHQMQLIGRLPASGSDLQRITASPPPQIVPYPPKSERPAAGTGRRPMDIERQVYPRR
eukprot:TRINITY_DN8311_c0_g2_i2.p1 TRINITY_DN8311_c0_g2~~TRINITY_DN8311_c0_g2_i2.p1  ORF type:complete len:2624 (-),score=403.77 TRINITY_DN8311_c0_g2_i2:81-7952(-)